jgi:hypothetical protein
MDKVASVLQLPEVSQVILTYLDDVDTNHLRCNHCLRQLIERLRSPSYWLDRVLKWWSQVLPDEPLDWKAFYVKVRYGDNKHWIAGRLLSLVQLPDYIRHEMTIIYKDVDGYEDSFDTHYAELLKDVLYGVILTDNLHKYRAVLDMYTTIRTVDVDDDVVLAVARRVTKQSHLLVLKSDGWNILLWEVQQGLMTKEPVDVLLPAAVQSNDIAHYLLIESLLPEDAYVFRIDVIMKVMLANSPQHIGFFLPKFTREVRSRLDALVSGRNLSILFGGDYNRYTRRFFRALLPYVQWNESVLEEIRGNASVFPMVSYLGLDTLIMGQLVAGTLTMHPIGYVIMIDG